MMLPNGWKKVKLEDVALLKAGKFVSAQTIAAKPDSVNIYPCFGGNGVRGFVPNFSHEGVFPIIGRQGALCGNVNLAQGKFYATEHAVVASPQNGNDSIWLYYALFYANLNQYATGQAQPGISVETINKVPFLLPSIEEQKKIAATLSVWDSAIEKMEKLIEAKENSYDCFLATSIMSDTYAELGTFLTEVSERNKDEKIQQVLSVSNSKGFVLPEEQFDRKVASENLSNYKIVRLGQYAYNPSRINVGSIARLNDWKEAVISPMYTVFEIGDQKQLDSDFLLHWLNSSEAKQRIKNSAQGSVRETVGFGDLCKIKIPKFDLKKQQKIVSVLNTMNQEILLFKQQLENYKKQKQGLMQKLLTGQWRVK